MWHPIALQKVISSHTILAVWDGIENCQNVTGNLCEQYQPISWNVPGSMTSISDNEVLCNEPIPIWQKIHNSETIRIEKTVNIDFSAPIV
jgi:hypothetical protein